MQTHQTASRQPAWTTCQPFSIITLAVETLLLQVMRVVAVPLAAGPSPAAPVAEDSAGQPLFGAAAAASWGGLRVAREVRALQYMNVCLKIEDMRNILLIT